MQSIGETIESQTDSPFNAGVEQSPPWGGNDATSFGSDLLHALQAMRAGDFPVRLAAYQDGLPGKIAETLNGIAAAKFSRVGEEVGREGKTRQRVKFGLSSGAWGEMEDSINTLIEDLSWPGVTRAIAVVAKGDLLQTVALDIDGSPMCGNLTDQVRNIAQITTAAARRDLSREIAVDVRGEILELKDTIDTMVNQFNAFASEVTRVACEVGTQGKLGGLSALTMWLHR